MARPTLEKVRSEALSLPESERAELAHSLVVSLDGPADANAESAWHAEILRRLGEIDSGTAELIDREELRRRMRARMSRSCHL
jgi:putative addiction module component (TIGR02574 family)